MVSELREQQEGSELREQKVDPVPWWWNGVVMDEDEGDEEGLDDESVLWEGEPVPWWWDVLFIDKDNHVWINEENFAMIRLEECVHLSPDTEWLQQ